jgi:hypothetical protein
MKSLIELNIAEIVTLTSFYSGIVEIDSIEELFEYEDEHELLKQILTLTNNYLGLLRLAVVNQCTLKEIDELLKDGKSSKAIEKLSDLKEYTDGCIDLFTEDDDEKDKSKALAMDKLIYKIAEVEYN